ncbi:hypothetical protein BAE44_0023986, partial [Dichanthelium oligosanthes]
LCIIGRPELLEVGDTTSDDPNSLITKTSTNAAIAVSNTSLGVSKLTLKWCAIYTCGSIECYCCENQKPKPLCYKSVQECQAVCPTCNPLCPPSPSQQMEMEGRPSSKATPNNATL